MLTHLLLRFFVTFFGASLDDSDAPKAAVQVQLEKIETERVAQVRLAEVLGSAEGIHSAYARGTTITFVITRDEQAFRVVASTRKGQVIALTIAPMSEGLERLELGGGLTWLADELEGVPAVTRLVADEDGAVTITVSDGRRYMVIPGRGSGGNAAVEARWGAEWNKG